MIRKIRIVRHGPKWGLAVDGALYDVFSEEAEARATAIRWAHNAERQGAEVEVRVTGEQGAEITLWPYARLVPALSLHAEQPPPQLSFDAVQPVEGCPPELKDLLLSALDAALHAR